MRECVCLCVCVGDGDSVGERTGLELGGRPEI